MTSYRHVTKCRLEVERAIHQRLRSYPELNGDTCGTVVPRLRLTHTFVSNTRGLTQVQFRPPAISHLIYARAAAAKR